MQNYWEGVAHHLDHNMDLIKSYKEHTLHSLMWTLILSTQPPAKAHVCLHGIVDTWKVILNGPKEKNQNTSIWPLFELPQAGVYAFLVSYFSKADSFIWQMIL